MKIAICGAGIAGTTLAWWLAREGHEILLVERAPGPRAGGHMLDLCGSGWDIAERMGLLGALADVHYEIPRLVFVDRGGTEQVSLGYRQVRRWFRGRHLNLVRGDIERVLLDALEPVASRIERRYATTVEAVESDGDAVIAALSDGSRERAALLVGADGVRSAVRARGLHVPDHRAIQPLGYCAAAFEIEADLPLRRALGGAFRTLTVPDRQVQTCPIRGGRIAVLLVHRDPESLDACGERDDGKGEMLRRVYRDAGWLVPELLERLPPDERIHVDSVSQVVVDCWHRGRVVLVGDACHAPSLLGGQGASMAMSGAWVLAASLGSARSVEDALAIYQARVRPASLRRQAASRRLAGWLVPRTQLQIHARNLALRTSALPGLGLVVSDALAGDDIVGRAQHGATARKEARWPT